MLIRDAYGRPLKSIRLLVTNECNYNCFFCHMEGSPTGKPLRVGEDPPSMKPSDYEILAEAAVRLGVSGFKITGGEPLTRSDILEVVSSISSQGSALDISMTTNGYLLEKLAKPLVEAGLKRVNVSLHSMKRDVYRRITGVDGLDEVLRGLAVSADLGLKVKINMVVLSGVNDGEVWDIAEFAGKIGATLQLIELIPVGRASSLERFSFKLKKIEDVLVEKGAKVEFRELHHRPVYRLPNGVVVEVVASPSNPLFCSGCDRIRVDPHGYMSPCINWKGERVGLLEAIRSAKSREEAVRAAMRALLETVWLRKPGYMFTLSDTMKHSRSPSLRERLRTPSRERDLEMLGFVCGDA